MKLSIPEYLDRVDEMGNTLLHYAVVRNQNHHISNLIEMGANIMIENCSGNTPVDVAIRNMPAKDLLNKLHETCWPYFGKRNKGKIKTSLEPAKQLMYHLDLRDPVLLEKMIRSRDHVAVEVMLAFGADLTEITNGIDLFFDSNIHLPRLIHPLIVRYTRIKTTQTMCLINHKLNYPLNKYMISYIMEFV